MGGGGSKCNPLQEKTLEGVARHIQEGKCSKIITLAGAGISTAAGIPDFRSPDSGIYNMLESYGLPYHDAIFDIRYFVRDPKPFFRLCKEIYPRDAKPTLTHFFITLLEEKGLLLRHYTQNVDSLERRAGLSKNKLVQAHGTIETAHCLKCKSAYSLAWMEEIIFSDEIPQCTKCKGVVKPDVVFFGENLPRSFFDNIQSDFKSCNFLIVLGTSLTVQPVASLVGRVDKSCPRVYINLTMPAKGTGLHFGSSSRDMYWLGECDDGCNKLIQLLKWTKDLELLKERIATSE